MAHLSVNDSHVLSQIFDPESAPSSAIHIDDALPQLPEMSSSTVETLKALEVEAIRPLNIASPSPAQLHTAISTLSSIIDAHPTYASAYNNRAQVLRMLLGSDLRDEKVANSTLWSDLRAAITLASPSSPASAISPFQAKILASAHTHRGDLLLRLSRPRIGTDNSGEPESSWSIPDELRGIDLHELEAMASREFWCGGKCGHKIAGNMAVATNPYAKMCAGIVMEGMRLEYATGEKQA